MGQKNVQGLKNSGEISINGLSSENNQKIKLKKSSKRKSTTCKSVQLTIKMKLMMYTMKGQFISPVSSLIRITPSTWVRKISKYEDTTLNDNIMTIIQIYVPLILSKIPETKEKWFTGRSGPMISNWVFYSWKEREIACWLCCHTVVSPADTRKRAKNARSKAPKLWGASSSKKSTPRMASWKKFEFRGELSIQFLIISDLFSKICWKNMHWFQYQTWFQIVWLPSPVL